MLEFAAKSVSCAANQTRNAAKTWKRQNR